MKLSKTFTLLIFIYFFSAEVFCQSLKNFNDVLGKQIIGKVIIKKVQEDISQRTFLGTVKYNNGKIKYYVVKEFLRIKAANLYHGNSRILFFNARKKLVLQSILTMPNELPFKLYKNTLYFRYKSGNSEKTFTQPIHPLPKMICVEPTSCYEVATP